MGRLIPTAIKEPFEQLPQGYLLFEVVQVQEGAVGKEGDEVYAVAADLVVVEPKEVVGIEHQETFFIGVRETDEAVKSGRAQADRNAELPETWINRAGRMMLFSEKAGVKWPDPQSTPQIDLDVLFSDLKGRKLVGHCEHHIQPELNRDGSKNQYAGNHRARISRWFAQGEQQAMLTPDVPAKPPRGQGGVAGPRPAGGPVAPAARPVMATAGAGPAAALAASRPAGPAPLRRLGR